MSEKFPLRFRVERELGAGALGAVALARDLQAGDRLVAVKILNAAAIGEAGVNFLKNEFQILRRLDHPGLAKALDFGIDVESGLAYLVQEFIAGADFYKASRDKDFRTIAKWGLSIARTLAYLHSRGVIHGDLKPENALVSERGPVLIDFGLASASSGAPASEGLRGTPAFLAPEIIRGATLSPRSDLYALGVILYQALSGRLPYIADTLSDLLLRALTAPPKPLREILPDIERPAAEIIDRLIAPDPTRRYQAAVGLARDLAPLLGEPLDIKPYSPAILPFIAREEELTTLKKWVDRSFEAGKGTMVIRGARGMGASRLLREAADYARTRGLMVGEAAFGAAQVAYGPIITLIENISSRPFEFPPLQPTADDYAAQLHRFGLWRQVGDRLAEEAKRAPLLIALDNLEEASDSAVDLVRYLVSRFTDEPGPSFIAAESDSQKAIPWGERTQVSALSARAAAEFAFEIWGEAPPEELAAKLAAVSGGNPLFLCEILRSLPPGTAPSGAVAPQSIETMFRAALSRLDASDIRLLEALAVWESPAKTEDMAELLGREAGELYEELRRLTDRGLLARRNGRFEIAWPFLARHIVNSMAIGPRRKLHARAADMLIPRPDTHAEKIALHLIEAGNTVASPEWAIKAGESLQAHGASREAAELYRRALRLVSESDPRKDKLLEGLGRAGSISGLIADALGAWRERIERAVDESPILRAVFHLEMARCQQLKGEYERAERAIKRAEDEIAGLGTGAQQAAPLQEVWELRAKGSLARGDYEAAVVAAEAGIKTAGSEKGAAPFFTVKGIAHTYTGNYDSAIRSFENALELFGKSQDAPRQALALSGLGMAHQHQNNAEEALLQYGKAFEIARKIGDLRAQTTLSMNIASVHHQGANYGAAIREYTYALRIAREIGSEADVTRIENNLGNLLIYMGRPAQALELVERSLSGARRLGLKAIEGYNYLLRGDILKSRGEMMGARREYLRAHRLLSGLGAAREATQVQLRLAGLYAEMGERARALASANEALESARRLSLRPFEAEAQLCLARLALQAGNAEDALAHARSAMALAEGIVGPGLFWEIRAVAGAALKKLGRRKEAQAELEKAYQIATSLRDSLPEEYRDAFLSGRAWTALIGDIERPAEEKGEKDKIGERWEKLLEINRQLNLEHDLTRLLELIMDSVLMLVKAERGFLIINRKGKLEVPVARNIDKESVSKAKGKISRSIAEEVFRTGVPLITVNAQQDERFDRFASVHDLKLRSVLCIPFRVKDTIVGTLYVDNRFQSGAFEHVDLRVMEAFADQAAIAIENARLIEENELKRRKLEASNERIQALVEELREKVDRQTREIDALQQDLDRLPPGPTKYNYVHIVGRSRVMRSVFALMDRITDSNIPVLIEGESGTGKELVARAIHFNGPRKARRFLSENCSAIPETLLESELFGHEKGAFTGAVERKIGLFEAADGGAIFLDEIGDMSLSMQSKLLRVLQEGEMRRVGAEKAITVDVRVISATHQRLEDLIRAGRFREDLYWRLNVIKIALPPMRERIEDIPLLVEHFVHALSEEMGRSINLSQDALRALMGYNWPGNVRELENEIKKAALMSEGAIKSSDLSPRIISAGGGGAWTDRESAILVEPITGIQLKDAIAEFEKRYLERVIAECGGNRAKAAKKLGIARRTLYDKLARYGMDEGDD